MHTKDFLAQELRKAGLEKMAKKAEEGYYHDFMSPLDFPEMQLMEDLKAAGADHLVVRHMNGEFDSSEEESEEWINSPEGKGAMERLSPEMRKVFWGKPN